MAALSLATDLAMGQPMEHAMATSVVAVRLGRLAGLTPPQLRDTYYQALLRYVGCNADVAWLASLAGDEIALRRDFARVDTTDDGAALALMLRSIRAAHEGTALDLVRTVLRSARQIPQLRASFFPGHCEVAGRLASRMGFPPSFVDSISQLYARWDGKGVPPLRGDAIAPATLVVALAQDALIFHREGGLPAVRAMLRKRSGRAHAPRLCAVFEREAQPLLEGVEGLRWDDVLAAEPGVPVLLDDAQFDAACEAMGDFADLRSPHHLGHARRVAELAAAAATRSGLDAQDVRRVHRAGLLHDIGRSGVPAFLSESTGPLTGRQWERIRLHPYYTGRILARPGPLADIGALAALHHERVDGSGYAMGLTGAMLDRAARLLAASDRYCALCETRAHRVALAPEAAAQAMREDARAGHLDPQSVEAVLQSAGHAAARERASHPGGLTGRECEVLRHLARGQTLKQIARTLGLSVKTVDRHVQNIYTRIGVSTRAAATLFAVENRLLD